HGSVTGRSRGVTTGATARLGLARLVQGDVGEAQLLVRAALAASGESFMPDVNGYVFKTAGLVNSLGTRQPRTCTASRCHRGVRAGCRDRRSGAGSHVLGRSHAVPPRGRR